LIIFFLISFLFFSSIITKVSLGAEKWLKTNLDIDLNDIEEEEKNNYIININHDDKENQEEDESIKKLINDFPEKPVIKAKELSGMNLSKEIIDAIYFHKGVLINELRAADINNTGMISPNEIMMSFIKANIHKDLTSQLIMDIINIYLSSKTDKIDFMKLISYFLKDLKILIENKNANKEKERERDKDYKTKGAINKSSVDFFHSNGNVRESLPKLGNGIETFNISNNECNSLIY
jgi:hypothetical protein